MIWICRIIGAYYTVRYSFKHFIQSGHIVLGHDFYYTNEVHYDHWVMACKRCGIRAGIDVGPKTQKK